MPKTFYNQDFPNLRRLAQLNSYYCGPAVIEVLASYLGGATTQEGVVKAAGLTPKTVKERGVTLEQMAKATGKIFPEYQFWYKKYATIRELAEIINTYKYPVGVEWQGVFDYPDEEVYEDEDDDPGHISVVTHVSTRENVIMIADPDQHYAGKDRRFTILQFDRRWWDIDEVVDPVTKKHHQVDDYHVMFVIVPQGETFPEKMGMIRG